jgi:hypothetical protein
MTALFPGHVVEACNPYAPGLFVVAGDEITARWDTLPLPDTPAHWDTLPLPDTPVPFWPTSRVYLEPDAADTTRLDPPPSMLARWEAENEPDPGPTDRQL